MKKLGVCAAVAALCGCGGNVVVDHYEPGDWHATEEAPVAAVGPTMDPADVPRGVVVTRLGPFERPTTIERVGLGQAPGWGCVTPAVLPVAAWSSLAERPEGDPGEDLQQVATDDGDASELGNGFELLKLDLEEAVNVPRGGFVFVGLAHADTTTCGAGTMGPAAVWRWRPEKGWSELAGGLVAGAEGFVR